MSTTYGWDGHHDVDGVGCHDSVLYGVVTDTCRAVDRTRVEEYLQTHRKHNSFMLQLDVTAMCHTYMSQLHDLCCGW